MLQHSYFYRKLADPAINFMLPLFTPWMEARKAIFFIKGKLILHALDQRKIQCVKKNCNAISESHDTLGAFMANGVRTISLGFLLSHLQE